jgi:exopolysaccharide production protein ExoZ
MISVQVLRAVAALSIVFCHFNYIEYALTGRINLAFPLYNLASGVDLFFVISGFIMVYSSEELFGAKAAWYTFLRRRLTRIIPIYWIATALAFTFVYSDASGFNPASNVAAFYSLPVAVFRILSSPCWRMDFKS